MICLRVGLATEATIQYLHNIWATLRYYDSLNYNTARIVFQLCDILRFISPIYYVPHTGSVCSHLWAVNLSSTLTSFPISAMKQKKNEVLCHLVDFRNSRHMYQCKIKIILNK